MFTSTHIARKYGCLPYDLAALPFYNPYGKRTARKLQESKSPYKEVQICEKLNERFVNDALGAVIQVLYFKIMFMQVSDSASWVSTETIKWTS